MTICAIKLCRNYSGKTKGDSNVTYHRIPRDLVLRSRWINIIKKSREEEFWEPAKHTYVCSDHFRIKDFYYAKAQGRRRLKKQSIPSKALFLSSTKSESDNSDAENILGSIEDTINPLHNQRVSGLERLDQPSSSNVECPKALGSIKKSEEYSSFNFVVPKVEAEVVIIAEKTEMSENSSDSVSLGSYCDTPRETKMRQELRRRIVLQKKHTLKIQSLRRKIIRLKKKVYLLKQVIATFKK